MLAAILGLLRLRPHVKVKRPQAAPLFRAVLDAAGAQTSAGAQRPDFLAWAPPLIKAWPS